MKGFSKTQYPNLIRNDKTGIYYARTRIGKNARKSKSLQTDVFSVAKIKLPRMLAQIRAMAGRLKGGNLTLNDCAEVYKQHRHTRKGKSLADRSVDYRSECVEAIRKTWPDFDKTKVALVTASDCAGWSKRARPLYGATRFNGMIDALRGFFKVAIIAGTIDKNPMLDPIVEIPRATFQFKKRHIPARDLFGRILLKLDSHPARKYAALSVRALAFTGLRPNEARHLRPDDFDASNQTLRARVTKNGKERTIELIPQAFDLFDKDLEKTIEALKMSPRRALATISLELKIKKLVPYDLRRLFSSRMDEANVSLAVGAETLGHQDRGQTRLKHYIEHNRDFIRKQMSKVVV